MVGRWLDAVMQTCDGENSIWTAMQGYLSLFSAYLGRFPAGSIQMPSNLLSMHSISIPYYTKLLHGRVTTRTGEHTLWKN